jgi:hypothetical protein
MSLTKVSYSMIDGACVNVLDYGAVGDGVTDDTAAIQAAINFASNNNLPIVYLPARKYIVSTLYMTYDAVLNPGFVSSRPGRIILKGDGQIPGGEAGLWNSSARVVGTVISSTATTASAIVMSTTAQGTSGSGFPNRKQILRDLTVVAGTSGFVIENNGAPDESGLEDVTVIQTSATGSGVLWLSSWYTYWKKVVITNTVTSTGVGARFGSSIFAGLYNFEICSFAGSFDNSVLMSGMAGSSNFNFKGCSFEGATSAGVLINSQCRNISFDGCYFEGNGVNNLRVDLASAVETLLLNNCMIFGGTLAANAPQGPLLYLSYAASADISNCTFFRPHTTCVYNAFDAGGPTGNRTTLRNCTVDISGATYSGGAFFYVADSNSQTGIPLFINNQILESATVVLINPAYIRGSEVSNNALRMLSYGFTSVFARDMDVVSEVDNIQVTQASMRIYTTTAASCVAQLPSGAGVSTARVFYLGNKASSTQSLDVLQPGGATLATLAAGEGIICVGDPNTSLYVGFKTTFAG